MIGIQNVIYVFTDMNSQIETRHEAYSNQNNWTEPRYLDPYVSTNQSLK